MEKLGGIFNPSSPEMEVMAGLTYYVIAISIVILAIIVVAVTYILIRYRKGSKDSSEPYQNFGDLRLEIVWTIIPIAIVAVLFQLTCSTMRAVDPPIGDHEPDIVVIGHQWWWEFYYPKSGVITANEVHIPVGKNLLLRVESIDVIHDFWIPELARKIDAIPGHTNYIWLSASESGVYLGACAEFCGTQHANMRIRLVAQTEEEFNEWQEQELVIPSTPRSGIAAKGAELFQTKACMNCHTIVGTPAAARIGLLNGLLIPRNTNRGHSCQI